MPSQVHTWCVKGVAATRVAALQRCSAAAAACAATFQRCNVAAAACAAALNALHARCGERGLHFKYTSSYLLLLHRHS